jgi:predicted Rossmann fold nucleotide-binding protein DprA/Smf involved in DNA uptake
VAKKAAPKKSAKKLTVLDAVYDVVRRARNGATIAQLKQKTGLNPRQLSNALYKLSTRGKIFAKSRGVYIKK